MFSLVGKSQRNDYGLSVKVNITIMVVGKSQHNDNDLSVKVNIAIMVCR